MKPQFVFLFILLQSFFSYAQFGNNPNLMQALNAAYNLRTAETAVVKNTVFNRLKVKYALQDLDEFLSIAQDNLFILKLFVNKYSDFTDKINEIEKLYNTLRLIPLSPSKTSKIKSLVDLHNKFLININSLILSINQSLKSEFSKQKLMIYNIAFYAQEFGYLFALENSGIILDELNFNIKKEEKKTFNQLKLSVNELINNKQYLSYANVDELKQLKSDIDLLDKIIKNPSGNEFINTVYNLTNKISKRTKNLL